MPLLQKLKKFKPAEKAKPGKRSSNKKTVSGSSNRRIYFFATGIIASILVMILLFNYETIQSNHSQAYADIVNEQQVVSQQIATYALDASIGSSAAFVQLKRLQARFVNTLNQLVAGNAAIGLPALPAELKPDLDKIEQAWVSYDQNINSILNARESIETVSEYVTLINESIPELMILSDDVVKILVRKNAPADSIATASRQIALLQSVQNSLNQILSGGDVVMAAADQFGRETAIIERVLIAMLEGSPEMGIKKFTGDELVGKLLQLADLFSVVKKNVNLILENSPQLFEVRDAAGDVQIISPKLLSSSRDLENSIKVFNERLQLFTFGAYLAAIVAAVLLILLGVLLVRESRARLLQSEQQNDTNQRAILRLLDEMTNLADGDLSSHTTVTEDITGAIADSVNYSIDALRDLVGTINQAAGQVSDAVTTTQKTTRTLAAASNRQAREIESAADAIDKISDSMREVSQNASDSADVARNSVSIAHNGGETVRKTIVGMESTREQIQETSKRIKRLGESSQEIGDIVNLITEISDQTNILALNAAIQASMAGEAGRGFAVVADEVQRLAERTGDATKQIEALVKTIQADTNEAIASMEQSTSHVVEGANLAEEAGSALEKIETVSTNLAQRILRISDATQKHAKETVSISANMQEIQQLTLKTSEDSAEASISIGKLTDMVEALRTSVAGFKLPEMEFTDSTIIHNIDDIDQMNFKKSQVN